MIPGDRPTDAAMWSSVAATLRDVVLPELRDGFARAATIQLIGLTTYARARGDDPGPARLAELARALDELATNRHVAPAWPQDDVLAACSHVLVAASGHDDGDAAAVRDGLRPILVRHLDEDLAAGEGLLAAFRGRVVDG